MVAASNRIDGWGAAICLGCIPDETDPISSPMKAKGVGELDMCGIAAAVANALYNATGAQVRDDPVTPDKLSEKMPTVSLEIREASRVATAILMHWRNNYV
jgi:hypothetical protein